MAGCTAYLRIVVEYEDRRGAVGDRVVRADVHRAGETEVLRLRKHRHCRMGGTDALYDVVPGAVVHDDDGPRPRRLDPVTSDMRASRPPDAS